MFYTLYLSKQNIDIFTKVDEKSVFDLAHHVVPKAQVWHDDWAGVNCTRPREDHAITSLQVRPRLLVAYFCGGKGMYIGV